jgi:hypothetical protein
MLANTNFTSCGGHQGAAIVSSSVNGCPGYVFASFVTIDSWSGEEAVYLKYNPPGYALFEYSNFFIPENGIAIYLQERFLDVRYCLFDGETTDFLTVSSGSWYNDYYGLSFDCVFSAGLNGDTRI